MCAGWLAAAEAGSPPEPASTSWASTAPTATSTASTMPTTARRRRYVASETDPVTAGRVVREVAERTGRREDRRSIGAGIDALEIGLVMVALMVPNFLPGSGFGRRCDRTTVR